MSIEEMSLLNKHGSARRMSIMKDKKKIKNNKKRVARSKQAAYDRPMTTLEKKRLTVLERRVTRLESVISRPSRDDEGEYQPAFLRTIRTALDESAPFELKKRGDLLKLIKKQSA